MKLTSLELKNFRSIEQLSLPMDRPLTVIAGLDNGDGKTSILEGIALAASELFVAMGVDGGMRPNWRADLRVEPNQVVDGLLNGFDAASHAENAAKNASKNAFVRVGTDWGELQAEWPVAEVSVITARKEALRRRVKAADNDGASLPVVIYYSTERGVIEWPDRPRPQPEGLLRPPPYTRNAARLRALEGALAARSSVKPTFEWFLDREAQELRVARERRQADPKGPEFTDPVLDGVRWALERAVPQCRRIRGASTTPAQIVVDWHAPDGRVTTLSHQQLSGGFRAQLALVLDLARRMCQANPMTGVDGQALVLIDEIGLHLHPSWQQTVVGQLRRAFPNVQFVMTTHSDQVISSVKPECVVLLDRRNGPLEFSTPRYTYGRRAEDVAKTLMQTRPRAANHDPLEEYAQLVAAGQGRSADAMALRATLEEALPPDDPALRAADTELRRQQLLAAIKR